MENKYDEKKIGKKIARGFDRIVYMYGDNEVIKFSTLTSVLGEKMHRKMVRDYEICKKIFGNYILETIDVTDKEGSHVEIQKYVLGVPFSSTHLKNPELYTQLKEIYHFNNTLIEKGYPQVDLIGHGSLRHFCLSNVLVSEDAKLVIIDATLIESRSLGIVGVLGLPVVFFIHLYQTIIFYYFKLI